MEHPNARVEAKADVEREIDRVSGKTAVPEHPGSRISEVRQREETDERVEVDLSKPALTNALVDRDVVSEVDAPRELAEVVVLDRGAEEIGRWARVELHLEEPRRDEIREVRDVEEIEEGSQSDPDQGDGSTEAIDEKPQKERKPSLRIATPHAVVKRLKFGDAGVTCCLDHLGEDGPECMTEGTIIYINRDHPLYKRESKKREAHILNIARLITQEISLMKDPENPREAYNRQSKLLRDAFMEGGD